MDSIYGSYGPALDATLNDIIGRIQAYSDDMKKKTGEAAYEHLIYRIKSENSMREKCDRKGLPQTAYSALHDIRDAIGIRIVCCFLDDIYRAIDFLKAWTASASSKKKIISATSTQWLPQLPRHFGTGRTL